MNVKVIISEGIDLGTAAWLASTQEWENGDAVLKPATEMPLLPQQGQWIRAEDILYEPKLTQIRTVANTNDALWAMLASVDCRIDFNAEIVVSLTKNY